MPRPIQSLRGNIARIVSANRDRHKDADQQREATLLSMEVERRRRGLTALLARISWFAPGDLAALSARHGGDFTVGEIYELLMAKHRLYCPACGYSLRGLQPQGHCPECGAPYRTGLLSWEELCAILAAELAIPPGQIGQGTWVIQRLEGCAREARSAARAAEGS